MAQPLILKDEQATIDYATQMANDMPQGSIILLYGDLGAGKTCFSRAFIRQAMQQPELAVPSPTFTLVQHYDAPRGAIMHMDLYRLEAADDIFELGWEDALSADVTALIEWPDRLGPYLPPHAVSCTLSPHQNGRLLHVQNPLQDPKP